MLRSCRSARCRRLPAGGGRDRAPAATIAVPAAASSRTSPTHFHTSASRILSAKAQSAGWPRETLAVATNTDRGHPATGGPLFHPVINDHDRRCKEQRQHNCPRAEPPCAGRREAAGPGAARRRRHEVLLDAHGQAPGIQRPTAGAPRAGRLQARLATATTPVDWSPTPASISGRDLEGQPAVTGRGRGQQHGPPSRRDGERLPWPSPGDSNRQEQTKKPERREQPARRRARLAPDSRLRSEPTARPVLRSSR